MVARLFKELGLLLSSVVLSTTWAPGSKKQAGKKHDPKEHPLFNGVGVLPGTTQSMMQDVTSEGPTAVGSSGYHDVPLPGGGVSHHQGKPVKWLRSGLLELPSFMVADPGGEALAISEQADVIVGYGYTEPDGGGYKAILWAAPDFEAEELRPLWGYAHSRAVDYSGMDEIAVGYCQEIPSSSTPYRRGCLWTRWGTPIALSEDLPNVVEKTSWVTAVSHSGNAIVGKMVFQPNNAWRPVVWWKHGLRRVKDARRGFDYVKSPDRGVIAVRSPHAPPDYAARTKHVEAKFGWKWSYVPIELPLLPEAIEGQASDVSADGTTIVGSCVGADGNYIPCKWILDPATTTWAVSAIWGLPDVGTGEATAVSGDGGVIVGYTSTRIVLPNGDEEYPQQGWIVSPAMGPRRIVDALTAEGLTGHQGWSLFQPQGISSDGHFVCGFARNPQGNEEGWVARLLNP